jgi:hypothetical protein
MQKTAHYFAHTNNVDLANVSLLRATPPEELKQYFIIQGRNLSDGIHVASNIRECLNLLQVPKTFSTYLILTSNSISPDF